MGDAIRWVGCVGAGGLFGLFLIGNWLLLLDTVMTNGVRKNEENHGKQAEVFISAERGKRPTSLVFPFLCGPVCAGACWLSPSPFLRKWFWVPLALDFTLLVLIGIGLAWVGRLFRKTGSV
jgi:hypothetical protein